MCQVKWGRGCSDLPSLKIGVVLPSRQEFPDYFRLLNWSYVNHSNLGFVIFELLIFELSSADRRLNGGERKVRFYGHGRQRSQLQERGHPEGKKPPPPQPLTFDPCLNPVPLCCSRFWAWRTSGSKRSLTDKKASFLRTTWSCRPPGKKQEVGPGYRGRGLSLKHHPGPDWIPDPDLLFWTKQDPAPSTPPSGFLTNEQTRNGHMTAVAWDWTGLKTDGEKDAESRKFSGAVLD